MRQRVTIALGIAAFVLAGVTVLFQQQNLTANTVGGTQPQLLFTNTQAANYIAGGQAIRVVRVFDGKVFTGYGYWGGGGPAIDLVSYDIATGAINDEFTQNTQEIDVMNIIHNKLFVPTIKHCCSPEMDYSWRNTGSSQWNFSAPFYTAHALDVKTTGSDLWLIGSCGLNACANHSLDDGATWVASDQLLLPALSGDCCARFYNGGYLNGKFYVQPISYNDAGTAWHTFPNSKVFDMATHTWSDGPDLGMNPGYYFWNVTTFANRLVYRFSGTLKSFDGTAVKIINPPSGCNTTTSTIDTANPGDGYFYVLANMCNGQYILRSADLTTWYKMSGNISGYSFTSFDVSGSNAYIGTSNSKVYALALGQTTTSPVPTTSSTPSTTKKCKALKCR